MEKHLNETTCCRIFHQEVPLKQSMKSGELRLVLYIPAVSLQHVTDRHQVNRYSPQLKDLDSYIFFALWALTFSWI